MTFTQALPLRIGAFIRALIVWLGLAGCLHAQDINKTVAPNSGGSDYFVDIQNTSGGSLYFYSAPTPAAARMSKMNSSLTAESPWGTAGNFAADPTNQVQNRLYQNEYLRVYAKTVAVNNNIDIEFAYSPSGPRYKVRVRVTTGALVTSMPILDPNPTGASSVRWRVNFDQPVSGVTAANFAFNNPANITGLSITSVTADSSQPSSSWTITAATGTGNGILGLKWNGTVSESPAVPNAFTGNLYDFTFAPVVSTQPVGGTINRNSTKTLSIVATLRGGGATPINYQWYGGATGPTATAISGATSASYTPPNFTALGTTTYFCKVYTNSSTFGYSNSADITVVDPPSVTTHPANAVIASGQTKQLTVSATGTSLVYQWYRGTAPSTTNPVGGNSPSFTTPQLTTNTSYWVRVSNAGPTVVNSNTATVTVVSGMAPGAASYTATVDQNFGTAYSVSARDSANQPVSGITVAFTAPSTGASGTFTGNLTTVNVVTNASGVATAPQFKANTVAGSYNVVASFSGALATNLPTTNTPAAPASLDFGTAPQATVVAGQVFSPAPVVRLKDAFGNVCTNNSSATATVARGSGSGTLLGTLSATASSGLFTFSNLKHEVAGAITLAFTSGSFSLNSSSITVQPAAPATVSASAGSGQTAAPGAAFANAVEVTVRDSFNNLVPSANVTFTSPGSGASCRLGSSNTSMAASTDASGKTSALPTANAFGGTYSVTAAVSGTSGASFILKNESPLDAWRYAGFGTYANSSTSGDHAMPRQDGVSNLAKYAFNLPTTAITPLAAGGTVGLPTIIRDGTGQIFYQFIRRKSTSNPGIDYWPESSASLVDFSSLSLSAAVVESIDTTWERVRVPVITSLETRRMYRTSLAYYSDFNSGTGGASLRGTAAWASQAIRLTPAVASQGGSIVMENVVNPAQPTGFTARFRIKTGPTTSGTPADGLSFAIGDLGTEAWGESGPTTAQNLTISFDTYENNNGTANATGIKLFVNGVFVSHNSLNPYTNGAFTDVEVRYDATSGVSVTFGATTVFNKVAVPAFTLTQGSKYGFGGRTGGSNQENWVDEVKISPR